MSTVTFAGRNLGDAWLLLGDLREGDARIGLSDGSWGLTDAIREITEQTGPDTRLTLAVWTASTDQLRALHTMHRQEYFKSVRLLIDRSMPSRDKQATDTLKELFGVEAVRVWSSHAKFAIFTGGELPVLLLTSANLARNRNVEDWSVYADEALAENYLDLARLLWRRQGAQVGFDEPARARRDTAAVLGPGQGTGRDNSLTPEYENWAPQDRPAIHR